MLRRCDYLAVPCMCSAMIGQYPLHVRYVPVLHRGTTGLHTAAGRAEISPVTGIRDMPHPICEVHTEPVRILSCTSQRIGRVARPCGGVA